MRNSLQIAYKAILELIREKQVLIIIFLFPVLMIGLYVLAYGDKGNGLADQMKIGILNQAVPTKTATNYDQRLIAYLQAQIFDDLPLFSIREFSDRDKAISNLHERQITALIIIPARFNQQIDLNIEPIPLEIIGNTFGSQYIFANSFLNGSIEGFNEYLNIQPDMSKQNKFNIQYDFLEGSGTMSDLDFGLPGILVFSLMFLTMSTAQILVREKTNKTFTRYRLSNIRPSEIFSGIMISQIGLALLLVPTSLFSAMIMGIHIRGSLWPLLLVSSILAISAVGIGLIVACFTRNESEAINIGASIVVPIVLMSNSLYPVDKKTIFTMFGQPISIYDFLPTSVASDLLRNSLIYLQTLQQNSFWFIWLILQTVLIFGFGAWLFNHFLYRNLSS
ncbi:MAG: ABC transporter permease [Anaerolineaceae bacterium]|nr:ABC transporter permease [Anaerolineaceae bacterium]